VSITLPRELLAKYRNPVFVETGTYKGDGVALAREVGFEEIHSIEIDPERYEQCRLRFKEAQGVFLYLGDSAKVFPQILARLTRRATIWLDAHAFGAGDTKEYSGTRWPLSEELRALAESALRKDHVLLIDDRHDFGLFGMTEDGVLETIRRINGAYQISFEDSKDRPKNILVAATL
jgi:hypothetical protein